MTTLIPPQFLDELRSRTPMRELVGRRVKLQRSGKTYKGCCPFHNERTPSFYVYEDGFHCFSGDTRIVTWDGVKPIQELVNTTPRLLTRHGKWIESKVLSFGHQQLWKLSLTRNRAKKVIYTTAGHRWFVHNGRYPVTTQNLLPGYRLEAELPGAGPNPGLDPEGVRHGIVFGDGTKHHRGDRTLVNLHGPKTVLESWFSGYTIAHGSRGEGKPFARVNTLPGWFKDLPPIEAKPDYLAGFIAGYLATDGCVDGQGNVILNNKDPGVLGHIRDICSRLGIGTFGINSQERLGYGKAPSRMFRINFVNSTLWPDLILRAEHADRFAKKDPAYERLRWAVESVEETARVEEVFCAQVPEEHAFVLEDNVLTGNCFGCSAHGDAIAWVMQTQGLEFRDAVEQLAAEAGLEMPQGTPEEQAEEEEHRRLRRALEIAQSDFVDALLRGQTEAPYRYLHDRGLWPQTIEKFGLGWAQGGGSLIESLIETKVSVSDSEAAGLTVDRREFFRERITFPLHDRRGKLVGFSARTLGDHKPKYLNTPETPLFKKGTTVYGLHLAREAVRAGQPLIVVEGQMDVIQLHQAGFTGAVAPLGTSLTREQLLELWRVSPEPIVCFDGDVAGAKASARLTSQAVEHLRVGYSLRVAPLPQGLDADELIRSGGRAAFQDVLDQAIPMVDHLWSILSAVDMEDPDQRAQLLTRIDETAASIPDKILAGEYRRSLRSRFFESRRVTGNGLTAAALAKPIEDNAYERRCLILLGLAILHQAIFPDVEDRLVGLRLPEAAGPILETLGHGADALAGLPGPAAAVAYLAISEAALLAADAEPLAVWEEIYRLCRDHDLKADILEATKAFAAEPTVANQAKLIALTKLLS